MNEKPILIEISRLLFRLFKGKTITGIDRVTMAYIEHYAARAQAVISFKGNINILNKQNSALVFQLLLDNQLKILSALSVNILSKHLFLNDIEKNTYAGCIYFNLNHKGIESKSYIKKIQQLQLKTVFFIHDLIPVYYPEYCREQEQEKHAERVKHMLQTGQAIVVNSEFTKKEVLQFAREQGISAPEIIVAWLSSKIHRPAPAEILDSNLQGKTYFVMLATIEARKNHLMLLQVWQRLIKKYGDDAPYLVLVGQRGWEAEQVFDLLDRCKMLKQRVIECSMSCDAALKQMLQQAQALLFPSFVEGYGLPLVEALSLGVPVLASDIEVFYEIGQGIPEYIDPIDALKWQDMIMQYSHADSEIRNAQLERLKQYQHWEWQDHFAKIQALLDAENTAAA